MCHCKVAQSAFWNLGQPAPVLPQPAGTDGSSFSLSLQCSPQGSLESRPGQPALVSASDNVELQVQADTACHNRPGGLWAEEAPWPASRRLRAGDMFGQRYLSALFLAV